MNATHHGIIKQSNDTFVELIKKYPIQNADWKINSDLENYLDVSLSDYMRFGSTRKLNKITTSLYKNVWVYFVRDRITPRREKNVKLDPWNRIFPSLEPLHNKTALLSKYDDFYEHHIIHDFTNKNIAWEVYLTSVAGWGLYCVELHCG